MTKRSMVGCLAPAVAQGVLRDCLEDGNLIPSRHFREELSNEKLTFEDALHVLRSGNIYDAAEHDVKTGEWKYAIEGYETEGKWIRIVFVFKTIDTVVLVTVYSIRGKRRNR